MPVPGRRIENRIAAFAALTACLRAVPPELRPVPIRLYYTGAFVLLLNCGHRFPMGNMHCCAPACAPAANWRSRF